MLIATMSGCFFPVPDVETEPALNRAPSIVEALPSRDGVFVQVVRGVGPKQFRVNRIEDPDLDDVLRGGWYLGARVTDEGEERFAASGQVIRDTNWTFDLEPCGVHRFKLNTEFVRLEALVGDREIISREVTEDGRTDSVVWTLRVDQDVDCPPTQDTE